MVNLRKKVDLGALLRANAVTIMFIVLCVVCLYFSGLTVPYVMYELFGRLSRNAFIVLALILPIVAGMGINFAVTIGAMAAQISALWVIEWGISGMNGFLVAMAMTVPLAAVFGYLIGKLLNKMKGQEMIGGLILGYFANGLYQLLFLFIDGNYQLPAQEAGSEEDCRPHRHLRRSVPGVSDPRCEEPVLHGADPHGHLCSGWSAVPVQQCADEDPSGSAVPCR